MVRLLTNDSSSRFLRVGKILTWLCVALLLTNTGQLTAQSASFGSSYVYGASVTAIIGQHDFQNGSGTLSQGIIGTERSTSSSFGFLKGASWLNANDNAFIDGYATTYSTGAFTFPVGDNGKYRPAAVTAASTALPASAAYFAANPTTAITTSLQGGNEAALPTGAPFAITAKGTGISTVTNKEYWDIKGATAAKISLTWDATSDITTLTSSTLTKLTIVGWDGTQWVKIPSTVDATSILGGASALAAGSITTNAALAPNTYTVYSFAALATSFTFDCAAASATGTFTANGTANQTGNLTIGLTGATAGSTTFTVTGTGFTGTLSTTLTANQASVVIPITYDGTGTAGSRTLTVTSAEATGTCTPSVSVVSGCATPTVGGTAAYSGGTLCDASNIGTAMLTGHTGNIVRWETSTNSGGSWSTITSTNTYYNFANAANAQQYRAVLNNGAGCLDENSAAATIATSATNCTSATCDNTTGNVTINITAPPSNSNTKSHIIFTNSSGVIQYVSAKDSVKVNGVAVGDYLVYRVVYDSTQTPLPTVTVGTSITAIGGVCTKFTNQLAYKVCPALIPDLVTTIGQPLTPFTAGQPSNVPITIKNMGNGPAPGIITTTMTLPTGMSAPTNFTSNGSTCSTTGQVVTCTNPGPIAAGDSIKILVPVTPNASTVGTTPTFTGTTSPVTGEVNTSNNNPTPTTTPSVLGVPDLVTIIGQPSPTLTIGQTSDVPITVKNVGTASAPGLITTTITLPTGTSAPANFTSNGSTCSTTGQVVTCTNPGPIAAGDSIKILVPVTPDASIVGTNPIFNATTTPVTGETNTGNNNATPTTTTSPVAPAAVGIPDLITIIGQPSPSLAVNQTSDLPITVKNIGTGAAPGVLTTTITLPVGVTAPANFASNTWGCTTTGQSVVCTNAGPLLAGRDSTFRIPITPNASLSGTNPTFNATTNPVAGEVNTGNNAATPTTTTMPVVGGSLLSIKVLLQGNYDPSTGWMHDTLRKNNLIPLSDPYRTAAYSTKFTHKKNGATQTTTNAILGITGANAIVDWVFIELHDAANPATVIATKAALIQRDGDVVSAADGISPVYMDSISSGNYYVAIRHRNHLGVMTATTRPLSATSTVVDFTTLSAANLWNKANGDGYETTQSGVRNLLWAGDTDGNRQTVFAGATNDTDPVFFDVMTAVQNVNFVPNYILKNQYLASDVNMDGKVIYQSADNEVDIILFMVLSHTLNTNFLPSFIIAEQLP